MRGNVMTLQPENSSVTMLRTNATENSGQNSPQGKAQPEETNSPSSSSTVGAPELSSNKQRDTSAAQSDGSFRLTRLRTPAFLLVASVAAIFVIVRVTGVQVPLIGQNPTNAAVSVRPVQKNTSGITPPDMAPAPAIPATQKPMLPPPASRIETVTAQSKTPLQPLLVPSSPPQADAAALASPTEEGREITQKAITDVPAVRDSHFENRIDAATALNTPVVQPQHQDSASDRLFIEMHRQLADMSTQMKDLQSKLDTTQQALNDRISTGLGKIDGRLDELQHREDLIENTKHPEVAVSTQGAPPKAAAPTDTKVIAATLAPAEHHVAKKIAKETVPAPLPHYSVQAGAPDIAILMDSSGNPLRVQPGSNLDGWGNVLAVVPAGNGWAVKTDHGIIR